MAWHSYKSIAALPTRERLNPARPTDAVYYDAGQVCYIIERYGALRALTSFGSLRDGKGMYTVGDTVEAHHDQTGRDFGFWKVVGVVEFRTGKSVGTVYDRKLSHWVVK